MPQILWTRNFLQAQGYGHNVFVVGHDNQTSILLEQHGRDVALSELSYQHSLLFVADPKSSGDLEVTFCPKSEMLAEYFTKPLQLFKRFCDLIINVILSNLSPMLKVIMIQTCHQMSVWITGVCWAVKYL